MKKIKLQGFSLIELLVACVIISLLLFTATSTFSNIYHQTLTKMQVMTLYHALQFARTEAIKRGQTVSLCGTVNFVQCHNLQPIGYLIYTKTQILRSEAIPHGSKLVFPKQPTIDFGAHGQSHTPCTLSVLTQHVSKDIVISTSGRIRVTS